MKRRRKQKNDYLIKFEGDYLEKDLDRKLGEFPKGNDKEQFFFLEMKENLTDE